MKASWLSILAAAAAFMVISTGQALTDEELTGEALAKKSGCLECHSVDEKVIGPAFRDIATKYRNVDRARSALIKKVEMGGKGNWTEVTGGVPMPAHSPRLSEAEIQRLVDWVMSQ